MRDGLEVFELADSGALLSGSIALLAADEAVTAGGGGGGGDRGDTILVVSVNCTGKIRLTVMGVCCVTESTVVFEAAVDELIQADGM